MKHLLNELYQDLAIKSKNTMNRQNDNPEKQLYELELSPKEKTDCRKKAE